jgi:hypothetical protein
MSGGGRTGSADFLSMAAKLGAASVIAKPFRSKDLTDLVGGVLDLPAA